MSGITELIESFKISSNWLEVLTVILLIFGLTISLLNQNSLVSYIVIFIIGILTGRIVYLKSNAMKSYVLILAGLVVGFILGVRYGTIILNVVFFVLGNVFSYVLHKKGIVD